MVFFLHCKKYKLNTAQMIAKLIKIVEKDMTDIVLEILNMHNEEVSLARKPSEFKRQGLTENDPLKFVKREKYSEDVVDYVILFFVEFIKDIIGEKDDSYIQTDIEMKQEEESFDS